MSRVATAHRLALLLESQVIGAVPGHLAGDSILTVDRPFEHLAEGRGHHQVTTRGHIPGEREALPREAGATVGDGHGWRGLGHARPRASAAPGVPGAVADRRDTNIRPVVIEAHEACDRDGRASLVWRREQSGARTGGRIR